MQVLVTGGSGYIGSHTLVELIEAGHSVVVVDDLSNSSKESLRSVEEITGHTIPFFKIDVRDIKSLKRIFTDFLFDAVIHFAGLKSVGESVESPLLYYGVNLDSTLALLEVMGEFNVTRLIFSSSATVYGTPEELPLKETSRVGIGITNPYGRTKFMIEQILTDVCAANPNLDITLLRYFNPIGAHPSGLIGEDPNGVPNNLLPYISQVAIGRLSVLKIFGNDYDTPDGTGVRDYIHVVDLAKGHVAALKRSNPGLDIFNLGTGVGTSVIELITAFELASDKKVPYEIVDRRIGDVASCYASPAKANKQLEWKASLTIEDACRDTWCWQSKNPNGF